MAFCGEMQTGFWTTLIMSSFRSRFGATASASTVSADITIHHLGRETAMELAFQRKSLR